MRPLLILATALLAWTLTVPALAPRPLAIGQVVRSHDALGAVWTPPRGQVLACVIRVAPGPQELLEPCLRGPGASLALTVAADAGLRVRAGDTVEIRSYDRRRTLIAVGRARVSGRWRVWLPVAGR